MSRQYQELEDLAEGVLIASVFLWSVGLMGLLLYPFVYDFGPCECPQGKVAAEIDGKNHCISEEEL